MKKIILVWIFFGLINLLNAQSFSLKSPDEAKELNIQVSDQITWSLKHSGSELVKRGSILFRIGNRQVITERPKVISEKRAFKNEEIESLVPLKFRYLKVTYNYLLLEFKNRFSIECRVYNDGFAYRIHTSLKDTITVEEELAEIEFPDHCRIFFPQEERLQSHYERTYIDTALAAIEPGTFASLPVLVQTVEGINMVITDADVHDFPNMFLQKDGTNTLRSIFPRAVLETVPAEKGSDRNEVITREASYIARTEGNRSFPWRVFIIASEDKELLENQLVYNLSPSSNSDFSWVKPGKVAWDWWNDNNIYGVDFVSGINNETYKYYIDFASDYGLDYVILDEGWSESTTSLLKTRPEINLPELINYGKSKNVGVILWVLWKPLYSNLDKILSYYAKLGVAGVKVDFMQRADQQMVNIYREIAENAAKYKLLVDFHGAFKPSGLNRSYPNVLTYEGVKGLENVKWSRFITPDHDLTLPFTRMVPGPMDYTPGAMRNKQKENYAISWSQPMSMGTRAHQVALYVVFESPLQMLADNPSNYRKEDECTRFISNIPVVWDKTHAISAEIGDYLIMARKNGDKWYIAALADWEPRNYEIELDFLDEETYQAVILHDGINANKHAEDFKIDILTLNKKDKIKINMANGGGFAAILTPVGK